MNSWVFRRPADRPKPVVFPFSLAPGGSGAMTGTASLTFGEAPTLTGTGRLAVGDTTLQDNLAAHWKLNEASGARADSVAGHTLTDNNTVGQAAGKIGNAADFIASASEYLSRANEADLDPAASGDFSLALWAFPHSGADNMISKIDAGVPNGW